MNSRAVLLRVFVVGIVLIFSVRLFSIQIVADEYKAAAQNNIINKIIEYPYRGLIFDRNNRLLTHNEPIYNLMIVPSEVDHRDSTTICSLLGISHDDYQTKYQKARRYSIVLPSIFYEQLSNEEFARIQDQIVDLSGYRIQARTTRAYDHSSLANVLGYVGEITPSQLRRDTTGYYKAGDFIGITGIESMYEKDLRGKRGVSYQIVDVRGSVIDKFSDGKYDTLPESGSNITLTIDLELQQYAEKLMEGKTGSVVAIDPSNGEILAFVSTPSYDPGLFRGRSFSENFLKIQEDSLKPLFNRPLQAMYPPGSMFKTIQALVAMNEKVVRPTEKIYCEGGLIGDLAPVGYYDMEKAIMLSSNNFFFKVYKRIIQQGFEESSFLDSRIGFERWRNYVLSFGLGTRLNIDLPNETAGFIPSLESYDKIYGVNRWKFSNIYSLSIGQGEILVTPLQMANLAAILGNRGVFHTPHFLKEIDGLEAAVSEKRSTMIDPQYFELVVNGMEKVVSSGSGRRGYIRDIALCGKTSTVENSQGYDHSGFMGFAPKDDPKIAIAVYVENVGWGGRAAASTASLVTERHIRGHITRQWLESYVLSGDFIDHETTD